MINDNRMAWIRNIEKLQESDKDSYFIEHEIATECRISGILDYDNGKILCGTLTNKDKRGLYHYLIKIQHLKIEEPYYNQEADKKGYYFRDGILGELLSLFALYFQCRFYLIASYSMELTCKGLRIKTENDFLYRPCNYQIHPKIFKNSKYCNFAIGLSDFLNSIKKLNTEKHQQFILSCYHYVKALKEVGVDREMVFIRLVSSIESIAKDFNLKKNDNPLSDKKFNEIFNNADLSKNQENQLKEFLNVNKKGSLNIEKSSLKFIRFIEKYSKGCLRGGNWKTKCIKISKKNLLKVLRKIYNARSNYLHNGEPMHMSFSLAGAKNWDIDPSLDMIIDNRKMQVSQKLPYEYWFENIVRCCLLNYLKEQNN